VLNNTLGKPVSTSPDSVAPENPQQDAAVDGFNATALPLRHSRRRAHHARQQGSNPFRQ
jgi:outer membrane protein